MQFSYDKPDKFLCHCKDDIWLAEKSCEIRPKVCRDLPKYGEVDGKSYCVLHFPGETKIADFIPIFEQRWKDEKFDFRGVWLPCEVNYSETFAKDVDFSYATFAGNVEFMCATFAGKAIFDDAKFIGYAAFETAVFKSEATFRGAKFSKDPSFFDITFEDSVSFQDAVFYESPNFHDAKFLSKSYFSLANFTKSCYFDSAQFFGYAGFENIKFHEKCSFNEAVFFDEADFSYSVFEENSNVIFQHTGFKGKADFRFAVLKGYVHFEGGNYKCFEPASSVEELAGEPKFTNVFENEADFGFARFEKPERLTFYKIRLCPSWFVNSDVRKMIFTDVVWGNCDGKASDLETEIKRLEQRELTNPNYLLTIIYRNFADTLAIQNRLEEAELFRKMVITIEQYKRNFNESF